MHRVFNQCYPHSTWWLQCPAFLLSLSTAHIAFVWMKILQYIEFQLHKTPCTHSFASQLDASNMIWACSRCNYSGSSTHACVRVCVWLTCIKTKSNTVEPTQPGRNWPNTWSISDSKLSFGEVSLFHTAVCIIHTWNDYVTTWYLIHRWMRNEYGVLFVSLEFYAIIWLMGLSWTIALA